MLDKKDKERYRQKLLDRKQEIVVQLSEFQNETRTIETGIAMDVGDKAESSYTKEFLLSLSNAERAELGMIDQALKRLETEDFGLCEDCGKSIPKKRLDVIPWTPHCITCQEKEERGY
jgi:DnaK suppressor protein